MGPLKQHTELVPPANLAVRATQFTRESCPFELTLKICGVYSFRMLVTEIAWAHTLSRETWTYLTCPSWWQEDMNEKNTYSKAGLGGMTEFEGDLNTSRINKILWLIALEEPHKLWWQARQPHRELNSTWFQYPRTRWVRPRWKRWCFTNLNNLKITQKGHLHLYIHRVLDNICETQSSDGCTGVGWGALPWRRKH